jgi:hypothetical protein
MAIYASQTGAARCQVAARYLWLLCLPQHSLTTVLLDCYAMLGIQHAVARVSVTDSKEV